MHYDIVKALSRATRLGALLTILTGGWAMTALAQTPTPPYALFQNASLTGSGNTINATRIPVVTAAGVTVYLNLTLQFNVDANGNLSVASGFPQVAPAPALLTSSLKAGNYVGPPTYLSGKGLITLTGPGVTDGGATVWTISASQGADNGTTPNSASVYVGPIQSNPYASRITAAGITSTVWNYGIANGYGYYKNSLVGVSQVGNTLTIANFSAYNGDAKTPVDQITYTIIQ